MPLVSTQSVATLFISNSIIGIDPAKLARFSNAPKHFNTSLFAHDNKNSIHSNSVFYI